MIDVHAHFAEEGYLFPDEWNKIRSAGVSRVILAGDSVEHTKMHRDFCKEYDGAFFTAGVHPSVTDGFSRGTVAEIKELCGDQKCVAVGEIGLDYHYEDTDKTKQREAFEAQLALASEEDLPVQIHSRDACADTLAILKNCERYLKSGILLHCYSYGRENMDAFLNFGAYFSFGGVACFKNAKKIWESVEACPLDRILSETDSPYLSPFRGEKNSPANIPVIVGRLAQLKGTDRETLERQIEQNAERLFPKISQ